MKEINNGKQMKDVWEYTQIPKAEKSFGYHPTQKTLELLKRIIVSSTDKNDLVLDPFSGTATTGIACKELKRKYLGIEIKTSFLKISKSRYNNSKRGAIK
jgi:site-specific DNA-methyltransferase (adenine-specific)